jgi:hypothetical protein
MDLDRLYITLDIDWADDDALAHVLDLLDQYDCKATFFVTHHSPVIARMRDNPRYERGVHPNFAPLLGARSDDDALATAAQVVDELMTIVPEARASRAHSLITGTPLLRLFHERGLVIDSNVYVPWRQVTPLTPWRFWTETLIVPFVWSDYIDMIRRGDGRPDDLLDVPGTLKVIAFHPIHIYLNTVDSAHYAAFRKSGLSAQEARRVLHRNAPGVGDAFRRLLDAVRRQRIATGLLGELPEAKYPAGSHGHAERSDHQRDPR